MQDAHARLSELEEALRRVNNHANVNSEMLDVHRLAISRGRSRPKDPTSKQDPFLAALNAAGYSLRGLAAVLGIKPSLLSMWRSPESPRAIPRATAEKVETLTGYRAISANWAGRIGS